MAEMAEAEVTIDHGLRFVLLGLECAFGVPFSGAECERVFRESESDQVSAKKYEFWSSPALRIGGSVGEYEPETLCLCIEGQRGCGEVLKRVVEAAKFAEVRYRRGCQQGNAEPGVGADSR